MPLSHNDDPTLIDGFANQDFIKEICSLISNCTPPKGIGINGYWGTGKTSTLLQIYYQLTGKYPYGDKPTDSPILEPSDVSIMPIWFEAWRYQHEGQPIVALLNEIRHQMGLWTKFQEKAGKLAGVALLGTISVFDEVIKVASGGVVKPELGKMQAIGNAWEAERFQQALPGQTIRTLLQEAINNVLKSNKNKKNKKLAIFIDDLDRCEPSVALRLMEGIKVYLNLNNCVVIFGMDQRQVERALVKALDLTDQDKVDGKAEHYAREYLEKICQDIIHLPLADMPKKSFYLMALLEAIIADTNKQHFLNEIRQITNRYDCLPANPRKMKALANRIASILRQIGQTTRGELFNVSQEQERISRDAALCLIIAILYCFHRTVYEQLQKNPAYIQTVFEYASASDLENKQYKPMLCILPSRDADRDLPVNPSDSNVFRLHQLLMDLSQITVDEIKPFINL